MKNATMALCFLVLFLPAQAEVRKSEAECAAQCSTKSASTQTTPNVQVKTDVKPTTERNRYREGSALAPRAADRPTSGQVGSTPSPSYRQRLVRKGLARYGFRR